MSAAPTPKKQSPSRHRKEKENKDKDKDKKDKVQKGNERLKVVVRRLPPNLPEDIFWQSVQSWVSEDTVSWKIFYPGKFKTKLNKENIPSRAYIAFKNIEQLALFSREYDGHLFRDKAGNESFAIVEFAPYQKVPGEKKKQDSRNATIEKDEDFISFLESLKTPSNAEPVTLESLIAAARPLSPPKTTPLLEALKAEKTAQKDKETILRSHAHYKDVTLLRNKDDLKKKAIAASANAKSNVAEAAGKKGKKGGPSAAPGITQNQSQKGASGSKAGPPPVPPPNTPGKKPKPQKNAHQQSRAQTTAVSNTPPPVNAQAPVTIASTSSADVTSPVPPASGAPRRVRPVIGLASRQFEAALSGVGVAASDRKNKREKDKEPAVSSSTPNGPNNKSAPPSPKRERAKRGGAPGGGKHPSLHPSAEPQVVKVPSILQRPDGAGPPAILQRDTQSAEGSSAPPPSTPVHTQGGGSGRGGRRGRGRGRGGPPAGAHRGG